MTSILKVDSIQNTAGTVIMPVMSGGIIQVQSVNKIDTQSITGTTFADVMSVTITPTRTNSKILVQCNINITCGLTDGNTTGARYSGVKLYRGSTQIAVNSDITGTQAAVWFSVQSTETANSGFQQKNSSGSFIDSPATTSAITYKIQAGNTYSNAHYTHINRPSYGASDSQTYVHKGISNMTIMEIAG